VARIHIGINRENIHMGGDSRLVQKMVYIADVYE